MATETLAPDGVSAPDGWTLAAGSDKPSACASNDGATSYIQSGTTPNTVQRLTLANPVTMPTNAVINYLRVRTACKRSGAVSAGYMRQVSVGVDTSESAEALAGASFTLLSTDFTAQPNGSVWNLSALQNAIVGIKNTSAESVDCTQLDGLINYRTRPRHGMGSVGAG